MRDRPGAESSPQRELDLAVAAYLGDAVARRRVDGFEYALIANRTILGWDLKARILPSRVNPRARDRPAVPASLGRWQDRSR